MMSNLNSNQMDSVWERHFATSSIMAYYKVLIEFEKGVILLRKLHVRGGYTSEFIDLT